ncbi:hypothetical protein GIB67_031545, partial [Kingdonia uniflora]
MIPDDTTFVSLLTFLNDPELLKVTTQIHAKIIKYGRAFDTTTINATITAYSECGDIKDSQRVFGGVEEFQDLVTGNFMLAAYVMHDKGDLAFEIFVDMQKRRIEQNMYTYTSVLSACYGSICKNQGKSLHVLVIKRGLDHIVPICNSLIAIYIKFNHKYLGDAMKLFNSMEFKDSVSWNSILTGFFQSGLSEEALKFFGHMRSMWHRIDHYAFSVVLRFCSDLAIFQLGQQVHVLVVKSSFLLNEFVASSLMLHGKIELASEIARLLLVLEPEEHCTYILLSDMYGHLGKWDERASVKKLMRKRGLKKVPGWSWIEVKNEVHAFNAEDRTQPQCESIFQISAELMEEIGFSARSDIVNSVAYDLVYIEGIYT